LIADAACCRYLNNHATNDISPPMLMMPRFDTFILLHAFDADMPMMPTLML